MSVVERNDFEMERSAISCLPMKAQASIFYTKVGLGRVGSGLGLIIFHEMSPRTKHSDL